jgi:molybdopterin synthase sulfur carrier subunit
LTVGHQTWQRHRVTVTVRLFAVLREIVGRSELDLELPAGATAEHAWRALVRDHPALDERRSHLAAAVNRRYADFDTPLAAGDEVVFVPPVSGG